MKSMTWPEALKSKPYKFVLYLENGEKIEGGAETKALCMDHLRHCLKHDASLRKAGIAKETYIKSAWYLGFNGEGKSPKKVTL